MAKIAEFTIATSIKKVTEEPYYTVRRLTPTECARLQGFPDAWCGNLETENPTEEELRKWHAASGLPLKKFFNTSGMLYKEMKLKDKIPEMSDDEMFSLLASDGLLVKRPIAVADDKVLVGFKEAEWEALFK